MYCSQHWCRPLPSGQRDTLLVDLEGTDEKHRKRYRFIADNRLVYNYLPSAAKLGGFSSQGRHLKEQLRSVPNRGIGYGVALSERDTSVTEQLQIPQAEVRFNYLGQLDQVLSESALFEVDRTPGTSRSPRGNRRYLLDISGFVLGGQLQLEWMYSEQMHRRTSIGAGSGFYHCDRSSAIANLPKLEAIRLLTFRQRT